MLNIVKLFAVLILVYSISSAQITGTSGIDLKIRTFSSDQKRQLTLNASAAYDEPVEGYILQNKYDDMLQGRIQPGGFSFLDEKVFGEPIAMLKNKWVENKFPISDLESLSNGVNVSKVFSFSITGLLKDPSDDTVSLFIKYSIYDLQKFKEKKPNVGLYDLGFDIKLRYKLIRVPFDNEIPLEFTDGLFGGKRITISVSKRNGDSGTLILPGENSLFEQVKKSAGQSRLNNPGFNFAVEFIQTDINTEPSFGVFQVDNFFIHDREYELKNYTMLKDSRTGEVSRLPVPVYHAHLKFPFILYNKEKSAAYKEYKTRNQAFASDYDIILVPLEIVKDTLTIDIFINYSKLNIDDMQRWTPIKKRIKIVSPFGLSLDMPKENWSAVFNKSGEEYKIYGYSDFERFINEYLYINFE